VKINQVKRVYFIGIGGIGMSALARYFNMHKIPVGGYDKVSKPLTQQLEKEGMIIHYEDEPSLIPSLFTDNKKNTLIVYTPAIPDYHRELRYFKKHGFNLMKRSEVLGMISEQKRCVAVSGTHGKTSVSAMIAALFKDSDVGCNAFIGGISKNFDSNIVLNPESNYLVAEADEFDHSFLHLKPEIGLITSIDPDHLDIYDNEGDLKEAFRSFVNNISKNGIIIKHRDAELIIPEEKKISRYSYSLDGDTDFHAENIQIKDGRYTFDFVTPNETIKNFSLAVPGLLNVENAIAALSVAYLNKLDKSKMINTLSKFEGIQRRFDVQFSSADMLYIDDYAHHPEEINYTIESVRAMYPNRKILGIFQPHLYSRTKYFAEEFARSLEKLDEAIVLNIYPAREEPIEGVTAELISEKVTKIPVIQINREKLIDNLSNRDIDILLTMGAGDIDEMVAPIKEFLNSNKKPE
jgi:UDP-N-acetylmuramate--alanine ligase